MVVSDTNGRVGIETASPTERLYVYADYENNDRFLYCLEGKFRATSSGTHWNAGTTSMFRPSASDGVVNDGYAIGEYITIHNNDPGTGTLDRL